MTAAPSEASVDFLVGRDRNRDSEGGCARRRLPRRRLALQERRERRNRSPKRPPSGLPEHRGDRNRISAVERLLRVHRGRNAAGSLLKVLQHVKGIRAPPGGVPRGGSGRGVLTIRRRSRSPGAKTGPARTIVKRAMRESCTVGERSPGGGRSNRNPGAGPMLPPQPRHLTARARGPAPGRSQAPGQRHALLSTNWTTPNPYPCWPRASGNPAQER